MPAGLAATSVYLHDDQGLSAGNMAIISGALRNAGLLNIMGMDWIAPGDWNSEPNARPGEWAAPVEVVLLPLNTATCNKSALGTAHDCA